MQEKLYPVATGKEHINTTVGELVEVITKIALQAGQTEREGYALAAMAVQRILKRSSTPGTRRRRSQKK